MKSSYIAALALAAVEVALAGSASAETKTIDLPPFDKIDASDGVRLTVTIGGAQRVTAENREGDFDDLILEVSGGELRASRKSKIFSFRKRQDYKIAVTIPALNALDVSSGADTGVSGLNAGVFVVDVSSGADARITGSCEQIKVDASSGADIDASKLICAEAAVDVSSGADAAVHATRRFIADASSGGGVTVYGKPKEVDIDTSSGGNVRMAD